MRFLLKFLCFIFLCGVLWTPGDSLAVGSGGNYNAPIVQDIFRRDPGHLKNLPSDVKPYFPYASPLKDYTENPDLKLYGEKVHLRTYGLRSIAQKIRLFIQRIMAPFAIVMIIWAGLSLMAGSKEDQAFTDRRNQIVGMAFGFILLMLSPVVVDEVFFGVSGDVMGDTTEPIVLYSPDDPLVYQRTPDKEISTIRARYGTSQLYGLYSFFSSFAVAVATAFLLYTLIRMVMSGGKEDEFGNAKKRVMYTLIGIAIIQVTEAVVNITTSGHKFSDNPRTDEAGKFQVPDTIQTIDFFIEWTNIFLGLVAVLSLVSAVWAGILILGHLGNDEYIEKGKNILKYAVIGLILAYASFTIVGQFVTATTV